MYDLSLQNYERAIEGDEKLSISRYIRVASILISRGSFQDCFSYLEKIEKNFGPQYFKDDEKQLLLLKSEVLLATGRTEESTKILRSLVEKHPLEGKALIMLAQIAWNKQDFATASLYFERSSKIAKWEVESLVQHGRMLVETRNYEKAVRLLERAESIEPQPRVNRFLESIRNLLLSSRVRL